jgi:hypothetical protein
MPDNGRCRGLISLDIQEGELDGVSLGGAKAVFASDFSNVWTAGNFTAVVVLDSKASKEQLDALKKILSGEAGGDAAGIAALVSDFRGFEEAPIDYAYGEGEITLRAGDLVDCAGTILRNVDGSAEIQITNAHYPFPNVIAGKSSKVMVRAGGLDFDVPGTGMWTGPFELKG